jgi:hypothetical protein
VYYLVAGRWFSAPDFIGPWTFATPTLPPDFKAISVEHPRSRVLASVPGTRQAAEAVVLAQIPQTARVNRTSLKAPDVQYQGEPQFRSIEQTSLQRALNTDKDIIKVGDLDFMCFQGVWFVSTTPQGPWQVASSIPKQHVRAAWRRLGAHRARDRQRHRQHRARHSDGRGCGGESEWA